MSLSNERTSLRHVQHTIRENARQAGRNLEWIKEHLPPSILGSLAGEPDALAALAASLHSLCDNRRILLTDRPDSLIQALVNFPGSLAETLRSLQERHIVFAEFAHSDAPIPGIQDTLEVQRFLFNPKSWEELSAAPHTAMPAPLKRRIMTELRRLSPESDPGRCESALQVLWVNNPRYVLGIAPDEVAHLIQLYDEVNANNGIFVRMEEMATASGATGYRVRFGVHNPPRRGFLLQTMDVFRKLGIPVHYACCITLAARNHPVFLGDFHLSRSYGKTFSADAEIFKKVQAELYNTQILGIRSPTYAVCCDTPRLSGVEASLIDAFAAFCHTTLAHTRPDSFDREGVMRAFHAHLDITLQLVELFATKFDPDIEGREARYAKLLEETTHLVANYNTGRRFLDEFRRVIFTCCLSFIRNTLKTNFYVLEKQALSFRLDPAYLEELDRSFTDDLPPERPFRITYFFSRHGLGYHVGFSDISRGGWRTVITHGRDDYVTAANTVFREVYVLAHTQHLKNKDIYQGGAKLVSVLAASSRDDAETTTLKLYKLQWGFINAFLDIIVTDAGKARHPRVVDYYGDDEPIEIGPDENMHDLMVEAIARVSAKRGYFLGIGIISSKKVGIGHKDYGVTSLGVFTFARETMSHLGVDILADPFRVKLTGGPSGDVGGNSLRLLVERCPKANISLILDGTAALHDPRGADHAEIKRLLMNHDLADFDPNALHPGAFILYRNVCRSEGLHRLHKRVTRTEKGIEEQWVSVDECNREFNDLIFTVPADLFIPCGGRPETVHSGNWRQFLDKEGRATMRAVVEGANSFITPQAREELQRAGVIVMRDASANKCGVITSSYEIIANLLLSEKEFLAHKERYVKDVLKILAKRASDEARLIFARHEAQRFESKFYTEISADVSREINAYDARLLEYFGAHPQLCGQPAYRAIILRHMPAMIAQDKRLRARVGKMPIKYQVAILAVEIATSIVYGADKDADIEGIIWSQLRKAGAGKA